MIEVCLWLLQWGSIRREHALRTQRDSPQDYDEYSCHLSSAFTITSLKRNILIYGLCGGLLIVVLRLIEYRFLIIGHSLEIYGGLIAVVFAAVGIWLGLKLTRKEEVVVVREVQVQVPAPETFVFNERKQLELGITKRELEILSLIAGGLSNREIAEKLFVSENTVKTHSSRLFDKMNAKRRTQAVQIGKEFSLIP